MVSGVTARIATPNTKDFAGTLVTKEDIEGLKSPVTMVCTGMCWTCCRLQNYLRKQVDILQAGCSYETI